MADLTRHVLQGELALCFISAICSGSKLIIDQQLPCACHDHVHSVGQEILSAAIGHVICHAGFTFVPACLAYIHALCNCIHDKVCSAVSNDAVSNDAVLQIRAFGLVLPAACTSLTAGTQKGTLAD